MSDTPRCCAEPERLARPTHPPGQGQLLARIGTWSSFRAAMIDRLPTFELPDGDHAGARPLAALTTRSPSDPTLAFLDAVACTADVLTFYQERIANEGYLRTATERRSVLELARAVGYELDPGVAASGFVALTLDRTPQAPDRLAFEAGAAFQSVPGPGERPATFESAEALVAWPELNALGLRLTEPRRLERGDPVVFVRGTRHRLAPGDGLLVVGDERAAADGEERWEFRTIVAAEALPALDLTALTLDRGLGWEGDGRAYDPPQEGVRMYVLRRRTALWGHDAPEWRALPLAVRELFDAGLGDRTDGDPWPDTGAREWPGFGLDEDEDGPTYESPVEKELGAEAPWLDLDGKHDGIVPGSWVALQDGQYVELVGVRQVETGTRTAFQLTRPFTRVFLDAAADLDALKAFGRRSTVAWLEEGRLEPGGWPLPDRVEGDRLDVLGVDLPLERGRRLIVRGERHDTGEGVHLVVQVHAVEPRDDHTVVVLTDPLEHPLRRASVTVYGNVVPVTHGASAPEEVLGSGDATVPWQRFALARAPLTHVWGAGGEGVRPELEIRVDGVRWSRVDRLLDQPPDARVYTLQVDDDGVTHVRFGDGVTGARLPTGLDNVTARYREGLGRAGNVAADAIRLPKARPPGLSGVTNPLPTTGGVDRERLADARHNAPLKVLTLDRLVSLRDFEDFARAHPSVAKALAVAAWAGQRRVVHLTVVGPTGDETDFGPLLAEIRALKDPVQPVVLSVYRRAAFRLSAQVTVHDDHRVDDVLAAVRAELRRAYGDEARELGAAVTATGLVAAMHRVAGVVAVDLDALYRTDDDEGLPGDDVPERTLEQRWLRPVLLARGPERDGEGFLGAELLALDPSDEALALEGVRP